MVRLYVRANTVDFVEVINLRKAQESVGWDPLRWLFFLMSYLQS